MHTFAIRVAQGVTVRVAVRVAVCVAVGVAMGVAVMVIVSARGWHYGYTCVVRVCA